MHYKLKQKNKVLIIQEEVKVVQSDHDIILEKGDKIEVLPKKDEAVSMTRNGWEYDSHDLARDGFPSLGKETRDGRLLVVITYDKGIREPFQVAEEDTEDWSADWAENFATMDQVKNVVQRRQGLRVDTEDLLVLMGE